MTASSLVRLRVWRTRKLMSVRALAEAAAITPRTLTDLEYGRHRPTYATMRRISRALGVAPAEILEFATALNSYETGPARPVADEAAGTQGVTRERRSAG